MKCSQKVLKHIPAFELNGDGFTQKSFDFAKFLPSVLFRLRASTAAALSFFHDPFFAA